MDYDTAEYVGTDPRYVGQLGRIRPDEETYNLPLQDRLLCVLWHDPKLGYDWQLMPAADFRILVKIHV